MKKKIKILDCTLRDGGYYNNWKFEKSLVKNYLKSMNQANINYVEIGFRFLKKNSLYGPYAFISEKLIRSLNTNKNTKLAIMINGIEYFNLAEDYKNLFIHSNKSQISLIRIAINFNDFAKVKNISDFLKKRGYLVAINLMQSHGKKESDHIKIIKQIKSWNNCDILYFADSLGSMIPEDVKKLSKIYASNWKKEFGFHSHNNRTFSLANSVEAINSGATFIDSTICGMGRGAGNLSTESLLIELNNLELHKGSVDKISKISNSFKRLQTIYKWGPNSFYHLASLNNIHPTYIQMLTSDNRHSDQQIFDSIKFLSKVKSSSYNHQSLKESIYINEKEVSGKWNATNWLKNKDVLIIGSGPSLIKNKSKILTFIKNKKPKVLFLNLNNVFPEKIALATIICHQERIVTEITLYKKLKKPIIIPLNRLEPELKLKLRKNKIYDYSLTLRDNTFKINSNGCVLNWPLAFSYALSIVTEANVNNIYLAGFDGYYKHDHRQIEMNDILNKYSKLDGKKMIKSITKSTYNII